MAVIDRSTSPDPLDSDSPPTVPVRAGDLTDEQWQLIEPLIPRPAHVGGRPRIHSYRQLMDGVLYVITTGACWHDLPSRYPPWQTVNAYATTWRRAGVLDRVREIVGTGPASPDG